MQTADAVVIGAGVLGTSIAHQLAARGRRVVVLDKAAAPGDGSSGASSAIVRFTYSTSAGTLAAWESADLWAHLRDHLAAPADEVLPRLHRTGMVLLDAPVVPMATLEHHLAVAGVPYEWWDAADLRVALPGIETGRFYPPRPVSSDQFWDDPVGELRALVTPDAGYVDDPRLACASFAAAAARHGARLAFGTTVVAIDAQVDDTWVVRAADGEEYSAPVVVNAAGPWSAAVNALAGVGADHTVTTRPLRQEVHAVPAPRSLLAGGGQLPCLADPDLGIYVRPEPGGGLLIGGMEPACDPLEWVDDVDGADPNRTVDGFERQVARAARRFPDLRVPTRPVGIGGVYDVTPDWTPVYDRSERPGFYLATGTSGNQFKNAPLVGVLLAELVDAVEQGHDHDAVPVQVRGGRTGLAIDLGAFSRRRPLATTGTGVLG
ncbi:MAG TPA: FAD-dependent oxidoreductase [Propionicimonas sp.]